MAKQRRNRSKVLTSDALKRLKAGIRQHECDENGATKYSLEKLGELTGLDPETVKKVLERQGTDKRSLDRCFTAFGLTLTDEEFISAAQVTPPLLDPSFVGREEAIADLQELVNRNAKIIVIQARGGVGKTTLARRFLSQEFDSVLEFPIAKETKDIASIESLLEEKLRQLGEEPGREFLVSCDRLKRKLQNEQIGILIDNLEPALDAAGRFIEPHRRYMEVLRILADPSVRSTTLITSRERLRESGVTVQPYLLKSLDLGAWNEFFKNRELATDTPALEALHNAYGGNAKAMEIICSAIAQDFDGDVDAYWVTNQDDLFIERDLEDLVKQQFDRLQELDPDAFKLLCRMGCYRYQDVLTVPIEGLFCLMWDVSESRHRRVVKALQDRSLTDYEEGEFWLHPVVRAEAISRLRINQSWKTSNQVAAEFWTKSVESVENRKNALKALEAYYHYVAITDFSMAAMILIKQRPNRWEGAEPLGRSLYRLGLLQQPTLAINAIKNKVTIGFPASRLYNILGDLLWLSGQPRKAIECHEKSRKIATEAKRDVQSEEQRKWLTKLEVFALFNIGLCKVDLWELQEACSDIEKFRSICVDDDYKSKFPEEYSLEDCLACLAFLHASLGFKETASELANKACEGLPNAKLDTWATGYSFLFLGSTYKFLKDYDKSLDMYNKAIAFAEKAHYFQVKAKALSTMSEINRNNEEPEIAILNCLESIEILRKIGAKSDLAEALYQLGLSYQVVEEPEKSKANFEEAILLFFEMEAPKQVERVKQVMKIQN